MCAAKAGPQDGILLEKFHGFAAAPTLDLWGTPRLNKVEIARLEKVCETKVAPRSGFVF